MSIKPIQNDMCILIASHISDTSRLSFLKECIDSLIAQTIQVPIHISVSFSMSSIHNTFNDLILKYSHWVQLDLLNVHVRDTPTPQMRHYQLLLQEITDSNRPTWIMFCDDDDIYTATRVEQFVATIKQDSLIVNEISKKMYAGLYENTHGKSHQDMRHEYWSYCIHTSILEAFFATLIKHPIILDNKCCDVLFAEYLRRLSDTWVFSILQGTYYEYRVEENANSITGFIKSKQSIYTTNNAPPSMGDDAWLDYVIGWNDYLHENMHIYMHDTYLLALVGMSFDNIVRREFRGNYSIIDYVDQSHITKLRDVYDSVRSVCQEIYHIPILK